MDSFVFVLTLVAFIIVGVLLYSVLNKPKQIVVKKDIVAPAIIPVQTWGYGWRPYWRRHWRRGLPGL